METDVIEQRSRPTLPPRIGYTDLVTIRVPEARVRAIDWQAVRDLASSIKDIGLISPIWITRKFHEDDPETFSHYSLVIGEHRLEAFRLLYKEDPEIRLRMADGTPIPFRYIPYLSVEDNATQLFALEVHENVYRAELRWDERVRVLAAFHASVSGDNPDKSVITTARKLATAAGTNLDTVRRNVAQALIIKDHLDDVEVAAAPNQRTAWNAIKNKMQTKLQNTVSVAVVSPHTFLRGDCHVHLPTLPDNEFDLILSDPPYGVGADSWDMKSGRQHEYDDSIDVALNTMGVILHEGFRVTKERANIILFCDVRVFNEIHAMAEAAGWICWPKPLIWRKGQHGAAPWGQTGFQYTYEGLIYATKGGKGLVQPSIDVLQFEKVHNSIRVHPAEKPVPLLARLIEIAAMPGDKILDPCCGSGPIFRAGFRTGTIVTGIEIEETWWQHCENAMVPPTDKKDEANPVEIKPITLESLL
jgi:DNA modification methylase/ParB-like chromosome segregation protein Spo0J